VTIDPATPPESAAFLQALGIAATMYSPAELAQWLQAPQPLLGNQSPIELLATGQTLALFDILRAIDEGAYF